MGNWQTYIPVVKDLATIFAAVVAGTLAIAGFGSWKAQLKGKDEYELARRLLRAAFAVRDSIQLVRNPFGLVGDAELVAQSGPGGEKRSFLDVQTARMQIVYSALSNLDVEVLEAKVLWGEDVIDPRIMALRQCISTLAAKIWLLKSEEEQPSRHVTEALEADLAEARVVTHLYLNNDRDSNSFSIQLSKAVGEIEEALRPHLGRKVQGRMSPKFLVGRLFKRSPKLLR